VHGNAVAIEGWLLLVARRHVTSMADLTEAEAAELGPLLRRVSRALRASVDCAKTYVVEFSEHPDHRHVHVHVIPRSPELPDDQVGPGIFRNLGVDEDRRVPEERMNEIAGMVLKHLPVPSGDAPDG
jgi:diadenosine tetraphosphate (Ap4A) HIT family hydrolase